MKFINKLPAARMRCQLAQKNRQAKAGGLPGNGNSIMIGGGGAKKSQRGMTSHVHACGFRNAVATGDFQVVEIPAGSSGFDPCLTDQLEIAARPQP